MPKGKKPSSPKMPMKGKMPSPGMPPKGMMAGPAMPMRTPAPRQQMPPAGMPPKGMHMMPDGTLMKGKKHMKPMMGEMPAWAGKAMKPPVKPSKPAPKRKK